MMVSLLKKIFQIFIAIAIFSPGVLYSDNHNGLKTLEFKVFGKKGQSIQKMTINRIKTETFVRYVDSLGESSENIFSDEWKPLQIKYFDIQNREYLWIKFDYQNRRIISKGRIKKNYDLEEPVYDGNGSIFYVFSKILPPKDKTITFHVFQAKEKRIVKMYMKYLNQENIYIGGKMVQANVYETGLINGFLKFFWPYKYHYWFSVETSELLRYEGPVGHESSEIIEKEIL
ncbi:MAG: hypothetical protein OEV66_00370 [Spirochaetia bacterium]|nr:hypothetical protein [Spirochaetia bacterium]